MSIENLKDKDPFADAEASEDEADENISSNKVPSKIHVRVQQRNGRKSITTVTGLPKKFSRKKILKQIKKDFACNGNIVEDNGEQVIQLQGDQRKPLITFLTRKDTAKEPGLELDPSLIQEHGF
ncbi:unnamed protein product [Discula destructiva]